MLSSRALLPVLAGIAWRPLTVTAFRAVPLRSFVAHVQREGRPNLRFMSGRRNRFNLAGTPCLYVAEQDETARVELRHGFEDLTLDEAIFHIKCELPRVLDLTDHDVCAALRLTERDLFAPWETARRSTATQRLGELVLRGGRFDAIRFPSNAMRAVKKAGVNLVIAEVAALDPAKVTVADYEDFKA
jgi:RES domain-containing protein